MDTLYGKEINPRQLGSLTLAFIGDAVFELLVRERLLQQAEYKVGEFNQKKVDKVNARSQAEAAKILLPYLTEDELSVFKRGRNTQTTNTPKSATQCEYQYATGLEALFGYLYINGETGRLKTLFDMIPF